MHCLYLQHLQLYLQHFINFITLIIAGNTFDCSCEMIWLRAWYEETNSFTQYPGPRCRDGGMLREARLSRSDCQQTDSRSNQIPLTNEHGDIFSRQIDMNISNDCEDITENIDELPTQSSINRPYPTESEYFYDQYVDYSTNDTNSIIKNTTSSSSIVGNIVENPAINITNTVLNYNKFKQQQQQYQQRGSQFTFFGVPLPSLNMGNLWNNNNGRSANTRSTMGTKGKARVQVYKPEDMEIYKFLNRNDQQETTISRNGNSQTTFDDNEQNRSYYRPYFKTPFSEPQMENGGFTPMLPGSSGGFRPIHNPHANVSEQLQSQHSSNIQRIQKNSSLSEPEVHHELVPLVTEMSTKNRIFSIQELETGVTSEQPTQLNVLSEQQPEPDLSYIEWQDAAAITTTISPLQNFLADISTSSSSSISDVYDEYSEATAVPPIDAAISFSEQTVLQVSTSSTTEKFIPTTLKPQTANTHDPWLNINGNSPSSLSELVAPGAQLPSEGSSGYRSSPAGRSTITKIFSTPIPVAEEYQRTTSVMKNTNQNNRIYDDDSWTVIEERSTTSSTTMKPLYNKKADMDWYYANYNQSTVVDTFDPSLNSLRSAASNQCTMTRIPNMISNGSLLSLNVLFILLRRF